MADPREEWRCGRCSWWEERYSVDEVGRGRCLSDRAAELILPPEDRGRHDFLMTLETFGRRLFTAKPLEDKGADIPIALHNEG
jgi:hypothetical protein